MDLYVKRVTANPALHRAQLKRLLNGDPQKFPVPRTRTRRHLVNEGLTSTEFSLDQHADLPNSVIVTMSKHKAVNGDYKGSPHRLDHFNITSIEMLVDGTPYGQRLEMDFSKKHYGAVYAHNLAALGLSRSRVSNGITYEKFAEGCVFFAWNLNADQLDPDESHTQFHLKSKGSLGFRLTFADGLDDAITVNVTDSREELLEIDLEKRVHTTASII